MATSKKNTIRSEVHYVNQIDDCTSSPSLFETQRPENTHHLPDITLARKILG